MHAMCYTFLFFAAVFAAPTVELISAVIITNTGSRNMIYPEFFSIASDPQTNKSHGRLTKIGRRQHYLLGRELAFQYKDLLTDVYPPFQVHAVSTGDGSAVESAQAFLIGFCPPGTGSLLLSPQREKVRPPIKVRGLEQLQKELGFAALPRLQRVIATRQMSEVNDSYFKPHENCAAFKEEEKKLADELDDLDIRFRNFYNSLKEYEGLPSEINWNTEYCYKLQDTIQALKWNGHTWKVKLTPDSEKLLEACALADVYRRLLGGRLRPRLMTHFLLDGVKTQFEQATNGTADARKVTLYFLSDLHILAVFKVFGWESDEVVPFAASLILELYYNNSKETEEKKRYIVRAKYNGVELYFNRSWAFASDVIAFISQATFKTEAEYFKACTIPVVTNFDREYYVSISVLMWMFFIAIWGTSWYLTLSEKKAPVQPEEAVINY